MGLPGDSGAPGASDSRTLGLYSLTIELSGLFRDFQTVRPPSCVFGSNSVILLLSDSSIHFCLFLIPRLQDSWASAGHRVTYMLVYMHICCMEARINEAVHTNGRIRIKTTTRTYTHVYG